MCYPYHTNPIPLLDDASSTTCHRLAKVSMKELFGVAQLKKDGTEGLKKDIPPIRELQVH